MEVEDSNGMAWEPDEYDQVTDAVLKSKLIFLRRRLQTILTFSLFVSTGYVQQGDDTTIPEELERVLKSISRSGLIPYEWTDLIVLFKRKTNKVSYCLLSYKSHYYHIIHYTIRFSRRSLVQRDLQVR